MVGENIKKYRVESGLTQKDLAERLFVTSQAVSRWENGDVEPSITTLTALADIFGVSIDEIIGRANKEVVEELPKENKNEELKKELKDELKEELKREAPKPQVVLAVCQNCNEPIYNKNEIVRVNLGFHNKIICSKCDSKLKEANRKRKIYKTNSRRMKSYIWGGLAAAIILISFIIDVINTKVYSDLLTGLVSSYAIFAFIGCLFLPNNFVGEMVEEITSWGFVKMPGVIFTLDIDGIIWAISVKIAFFFIGILLGILSFLFSLVIGALVSIFVYPFAIIKSYRKPEYQYE